MACTTWEDEHGRCRDEVHRSRPTKRATLCHLKPQFRVHQEMLDKASRGVVVTAVFQEPERGFENGDLMSLQTFASQPRPLQPPLER